MDVQEYEMNKPVSISLQKYNWTFDGPFGASGYSGKTIMYIDFVLCISFFSMISYLPGNGCVL